MRRALVVVAAIVVAVGAVAALAPAALVSVFVGRMSGGALLLAEAEGTVWHGRGVLDAGQALRLPLEWRLGALPLVRGEVSVAIAPTGPASASLQADLSVHGNAMDVRSLDLSRPAAAVTALTPHAGVQLDGGLRVSAPSLEWAGASFNGGALVRWQDARFGIGSEASMALGNIRADLAAAGDRLVGPVTNEGGDFDVRGTVSLGMRAPPEVSLTLSPRGGGASQARSLRVSARPDGSWNVDYRAGTP